MRQETQIEIIERAFRNLERNERDMVPAPGGTDVHDYVSPERLAREREVLFRRHPILIAHSSELPKPGDFLTHDDTGVPILLARGQDGRVRAFLNVCRHRGARLAEGRCGGRARTFVCPYHAWTYANDGRLLGITEPEGFPGVDPREHGLVGLPSVEKYGMIWVRPTPGGEPIDIDGFLGPLADDFAAYEVFPHAVFQPEQWVRKMNWKALVDTFLESYHFQYLHRRSISPLFHPNAIVFDNFSPHCRIVTVKTTVNELRGTDKAGWSLRPHGILLYLLFPNTVLVWLQDHLASFTMFPRGPEEGVLWLSFHNAGPAEGRKAEEHWAENRRLIRSALSEDFAVGEGVQRNFSSGANRRLTFGRYEQGLSCFHRAVDQALAAA